MAFQASPLELHDFSLHEFNPVTNDSSYSSVLNGSTNKEPVKSEPAVDSGEHLSECSSLDDYTEVELPSDVPDGPKFDDLAAYVDGVAARLKADQQQSSHLAYDVSGESPLASENHCGSCSAPTSGGVEEFASFSTFEPSVVGSDAWATLSATFKQDLNCHESLQSEWPDGSSVVPPVFPGSHEGSDGEEFGDFESSVPHSEPSVVANLVRDVQIDHPPIGILERLLSHLEPALGRAFSSPTGNDWMNEEKAVSGITDLDTGSSRAVTHSLCKVNRPSLWPKMLPLHRTHAQRFHWSKSPIYDAYLQSLNVDPRSAMPAFASQLRLLEPVRLDAVNRSSSTVQSSKASTLSSPARTSGSSLKSNTDRSSTSSSTEPPEFDWNSSGLTNPLQETNANPIQLDLDFFELQQQPTQQQMNLSLEKSSGVAELERELFSAVVKPPSSAAPQLVVTQSSATPAPPERSKNVRTALMRLPKLTYMRAKCLIFPVAEEKPT
ncbi:Aftiphilin, variant 2 [Clonorchis sinensis]|uniref:Aftiphilin, variant 2 n=1 Tax=Clonorchis sinensis TaxID=79923 RepID=A0A8T1MTG4_CLOSI|nr:Aftiphilin, variant 2 [Clonorchis sinensis]